MDHTLQEGPDDVSTQLRTATSRTRQRMMDEQARADDEVDGKDIAADEGGVADATPPETARSSMGTPRSMLYSFLR